MASIDNCKIICEVMGERSMSSNRRRGERPGPRPPPGSCRTHPIPGGLQRGGLASTDHGAHLRRTTARAPRREARRHQICRQTTSPVDPSTVSRRRCLKIEQHGSLERNGRRRRRRPAKLTSLSWWQSFCSLHDHACDVARERSIMCASPHHCIMFGNLLTLIFEGLQSRQ